MQQPEHEQPPGIENRRPAKGVWEFWPTVGLGAAIFAIYLVVQLIVVVAFLIYHVAASGLPDPMQLTESLITNGLMLSLATILGGAAGVGFIILFVKIRKGPSVSEYLRLVPIKKSTTVILLGVTAGLLAIFSLTDRFFPDSTNMDFMINFYDSSLSPILLFIAVVIFAPAFEEGFFRGFLFPGFSKSRLGPIGTIALTSFLWAILHIQYDIYGIASILILGIVLGIVRLKTSSLWGPLLIHAAWNLVAMIGLALQVSGIGT